VVLLNIKRSSLCGTVSSLHILHKLRFGISAFEAVGILSSEFGKVLCRSEAAKRAVWAMVVVEVLGVDFVDAAGELVDGIELVAPGAIAALDGSNHLLTLWWQDVEADGLSWQACSNSAMKSDPTSTSMASTLKGMSRMILSMKRLPKPRWHG
jgi:hypothetical protein